MGTNVNKKEKEICEMETNVDLDKTIRLDAEDHGQAVEQGRGRGLMMSKMVGRKEERRGSASNVLTIDITDSGESERDTIGGAGRLVRSTSIGSAGVGGAKRKAEGRPGNEAKGQLSKRKDSDAYKNVDCVEAQTLMIAIEENADLVKAMQAAVAEIKDRKVELAFGKLRKNLEIFGREMIRKWLKDRAYAEVEKIHFEACTQTEPEGRDQGTQTGPWQGAGYGKVTSIEGVEYSSFMLVKDKEWKEELFQRTRVVVGNPVSGGEEVKVVLVEDRDEGMRTGAQALFGDRFPELRGLEGDVEVLETSTRVRSRGGMGGEE